MTLILIVRPCSLKLSRTANNQAPKGQQRKPIATQNEPDVHESQQPDTSESELDTLYIERIKSGAFVQLADLIPTRLGFKDTTRSKINHRSVANISEWLQALAVYVSVIAKTQPYHVPDLMGYQVPIIEASTEYRNNSWLAYDRCFWQQVAAHPQCKWSNIDSTLWTLAFTS